MTCVGIDLAGKKKNPTGFSVLEDRKINFGILKEDEEIIEKCKTKKPEIIAIDSPLNFSKENGFRDCDLELIERGYRVLPPDFGGMKSLTERGIKLAEELRELDFEVLEIHPLTSGLILFDTKSRDKWISILSERGWEVETDANEHEIDSVVAGLTGYLYLRGETKRIGGEEGIIIPEERPSVL